MTRLLVTLAFLAQAAPYDNYKKELEALFREHWDNRDKEFFEKDPELVYIDKLKDVAKRAAGTKWGAEALQRAFGAALRIGDERLGRALADECIAKYPDSDSHWEMAWSCYDRVLRSGPAWVKDVLWMIAKNSSSPDAKAGSRYWLGCLLVYDRKATADGKAEGRKLFEQVKKDYRGAKPHVWDHGLQPNYATLAEGCLFELDHLQVGMTAPDFEGTGLDGKTFKLSDFRGKMVVIDFWKSDRDWDRHFPDREALVERMKGKPFVLLGVN